MAYSDLNYLKKYSSDDDEFVIEMVELFVANTPGFLKEMETAFREGDHNIIARTAHKIKPSMSFMGIPNGKELCMELEEIAKSESIQKEQLESKMYSLIELCSNAIEELKVELTKLKA
jgi:HPt (histidine-containing phosphotransfer) domain-containing protein